MKPKTDIYQEVTDRIVSALESGTAPWLRPWRDSNNGSALEPYNAATGRPYNGINLLVLGSLPYSDLGWLTFKQAQGLGGMVRKGEKGTLVVFWNFSRTKTDDNGKTRVVPFARGYVVFNVSQCEGLDLAKLKRPIAPEAGETDMNALAARVGAVVRHGGNRAFYQPGGDYIQLPSADSFKSDSHYQATLSHELTHWTGAATRCDRQFGKRFGDSAYAFEELVAEIGSAFLCARTGVAMEGLQHDSYLAGWLKILKEDNRAIFTAASKARQACAFLLKDEETQEETDTTDDSPVTTPRPVAPPTPRPQPVAPRQPDLFG